MPHGRTGKAFTCLVPGCETHNDGRFGVLCSKHRQNRVRNGHPEQSAVTETELRPYEDHARRILEANRYKPLWETLFRRWQLAGDKADEVMAQWTRGQPMDKTVKAAAESFVAIKEEVEPMKVLSIIIGMHLYRAQRPHRFKSDEGFNFTLVRRVRALTKSHAVYYYHPNGKVRAANYIALPIASTKRVAEWINTVFGTIALAIVQKLEEKKQKDDEARRDFNRMVSEITVEDESP
ncbi:hypothetical protein [uncultured Alsobacter sp.]|uniref:hypothetical protein n=1 Tax=uncultured Alsobacter sp. TaxID=1748258 RepID=UPI0025F8F8F4|nr:hypothetical protein [uncultured Alsobacter sp.]